MNLTKEKNSYTQSLKSNPVKNYFFLFQEHIEKLIRLRNTGKDGYREKLTLTESRYTGISQYVLDFSACWEKEDENNDIDWDSIDEEKDLLLNKIHRNFDSNRHELLKKAVDCSADFYEKFLIYEQVHPNSAQNPWKDVSQLLLEGRFIFAFIENNKKENPYASKLTLSIINKEVTKNFQIDEIGNLQKIVLDFLQKEEKPITTKAILQMLKSHFQTDMEYPNLQQFVLKPLKAVGMITSSTKGYTYLKPEDALRKAEELESKSKALRKRATSLM